MKFSNSKTVIDAIIKNSEGKILVVDKLKTNGTYTILPGGKREEGESDEEALRRELREELGIGVDIGSKIGEILGFTDFGKKPINIILYETKALQENFKTEAEITNPRYLSIAEILELETTTELTRKAINLIVKNLI